MSFLKVGGENMERRNGMVGPPAPRILQLPRRHSVRRRNTISPKKKDQRVKLEALFHQERSFHHEEEGGRRRGKEVGFLLETLKGERESSLSRNGK